MAFPTCVGVVIATEGPLGCPVTAVFSPVAVSGAPALLGYDAFQVVVAHATPVPVASSGPAVAERRGRALHGAAVVDGLRGRWRGGREGETERCGGFLGSLQVGSIHAASQETLCMCVLVCVCMYGCACACTRSNRLFGLESFLHNQNKRCNRISSQKSDNRGQRLPYDAT